MSILINKDSRVVTFCLLCSNISCYGSVYIFYKLKYLYPIEPFGSFNTIV